MGNDKPNEYQRQNRSDIGCMVKIGLAIIAVIAYFVIRSKMNDRYWEKEREKSKLISERLKNARPIRIRPKRMTWHTCSICKCRCAEEDDEDPARYCDICGVWHCRSCYYQCPAENWRNPY